MPCRQRGFADLSPPEAQHAMLELPTNRADYVGMLKDIGDYPRRSPIGHRIPDEGEIEVLKKATGRWRVVVLLDDERALAAAATLFSHEFVLDPMYDSGALLYAAFHDPLIRDEHSRRLAEQAGLLVRAAPLLNAATAILAPDHLPGSWTPRPGWRKPRARDDPRQHAAWAMRCGLVLLYWADRLDALVCATRQDVIAALDIVFGERVATCTFDIDEPVRIDEAQAMRESSLPQLSAAWSLARGQARRRRAPPRRPGRHAWTDLSRRAASARVATVTWRRQRARTVAAPAPHSQWRRPRTGAAPASSQAPSSTAGAASDVTRSPAYQNCAPPLTTTICPVMKSLSLEARKTSAPSRSSGTSSRASARELRLRSI